VTPAPERQAPTSPASKTLGSLISTIIAFSGISPTSKTCKVSFNKIFKTIIELTP